MRSGYSDDYCEDWEYAMWRGAVASAFRGKRGQAFLRETIAALDALPEKRLAANGFVVEGAYCTLGVAAQARGIDPAKWGVGVMDEYDEPADAYAISADLGIARAMACEIMYMNDEGNERIETDEDRWERMRRWLVSCIQGASYE